MSTSVSFDPCPVVRLYGAGPDWTLPAGRAWVLLPLAGRGVLDFADGRAELSRGMVYLHAGAEAAVLRRTRRLRALAWPLHGALPEPLLGGVHADRALARAVLSTRGLPLCVDDPMVQRLAAQAAALLARCPGRAADTRRRLLQRLWRTHQRVLYAADAQTELAALAAVAVLSKFHFVRCFTRLFDAPPGAVRREARLRQAAQRVAEPGESLALIAMASGFQHASSFARAFRRRFGVCASDARRNSSMA
jgi:AraC-like DNA-binding protein